MTPGGLRTRTAALFATLWLTAGCAARIPLPRTTDAAAAQASWPGTSTADLERGRRVYVVRCGGCHLAHVPGERRPHDWPALVDKMAERAKLSTAERTDVVRYLSVMSEPH